MRYGISGHRDCVFHITTPSLFVEVKCRTLRLVSMKYASTPHRVYSTVRELLEVKNESWVRALKHHASICEAPRWLKLLEEAKGLLPLAAKLRLTLTRCPDIVGAQEHTLYLAMFLATMRTNTKLMVPRNWRECMWNNELGIPGPLASHDCKRL